MERKWTKEPWESDKQAYVWAKNPYGHGDMMVVEVRGYGHLTGKCACAMTEAQAEEIMIANMNRAAECVTACAPFDNPGEDIGALVDIAYGVVNYVLKDHTDDALTKVFKQATELLARVKEQP